MIKVIAEIGQNHQGDVSIAKKLIDVASWCGCWAVKSQKRSMRAEWADKPYDNPNSFGKTYLEHRKALELSPEQHEALMNYAGMKGLEYFVSPWDKDSARLMDGIGMRYFKVPSACLTDIDLLDCLVGFEKPVIMSTGMSTWNEINKAGSILSNNLLCVMLCTSTYPCSFKDVRLKRILSLRSRVWAKKAEVGLSGHHLGIAIDVAAAAMGCTMIERHMTLDRSWKGSDHSASLEPDGMRKLVRDLKAFEEANCELPEIVDSEVPIREKLRGNAAK